MYPLEKASLIWLLVVRFRHSLGALDLTFVFGVRAQQGGECQIAALAADLFVAQQPAQLGFRGAIETAGDLLDARAVSHRELSAPGRYQPAPLKTMDRHGDARPAHAQHHRQEL